MHHLGQGRFDFDRDLVDEAYAFDERPAITEDTAHASIDALLSSSDRYRRGEDYQELLKFVATFRMYKPFNRMLVHLQDPGAQFVATPARWLRDYDRRIKPGARPLIIMQPNGPVMMVFDEHDVEPAVANPRPIPESVQNPLAIKYRDPAAEIEHRWRNLELNAVRDGIRINLADHGPHAGGEVRYLGDTGQHLTRRPARNAAADTIAETFPHRYDLIVNRTLAQRDQYATLVHELAHVYCGHLGSPDPASWKHWPHRPEVQHDVSELEAESVVHMVLARIDPNVEMGGYIGGQLKDGTVPPNVSLNAMMKAAGLIEEMGEGRLPKRKPKGSGSSAS